MCKLAQKYPQLVGHLWPASSYDTNKDFVVLVIVVVVSSSLHVQN